MIVHFIFGLFLLQMESDAHKFKIKLITMTRCSLPETKFSPDRPPRANYTIRKRDRDTPLLNLNITTTKRLGPIMMAYRTYQLQQNAVRNLIFKLEKVSCSNPVTFKIIRIMNANISRDCYVRPGLIYIKNFDFNSLSWLLTKSMTGAGKYAYEVEISDSKGILSCYVFVCEIIENKR